MLGTTPESLWGPEAGSQLSSDDGVESADIFTTAMENNFKAGRIIVDAILDGTL